MALSYEGIPPMLSTENSPVARHRTVANCSIYDKFAAIDADHVASDPLRLRVARHPVRPAPSPGGGHPPGGVLALGIPGLPSGPGVFPQARVAVPPPLVP